MDRQTDMYNKSFISLKEAANYKPSPQPMRASLYSKPSQPDQHQYEDPTLLAKQILSRSTGARKKQNAVYEPSGPFHSSKETKPRRTSRKNKCIYFMMFLIFIVAVSTLILILLLMMGKVGRSCSCGDQGKNFNRIADFVLTADDRSVYLIDNTLANKIGAKTTFHKCVI